MGVQRGLFGLFFKREYTNDVEACSAEMPLLFVSEIIATQNSLEQCLTFFHSSERLTLGLGGEGCRFAL